MGDNRPPCGNCGLNNHSTTECKKKVEPSNEDHQRVAITCFLCGKQGHEARNCRFRPGQNIQRAAAMQLITQPLCQVETGPKLEVKYHACDEARDDEGVKLACGCKLPIIAGAINVKHSHK